jgi:uncharacterized protein (TIGR03083 family)
VDHAQFCDAARAEVESFAVLVDGADLSGPVPTCPDWTLADLIGHTGTVHRWATWHVANLAPTRTSSSDLGIVPPNDPASLPRWLADGAGPMTDAFCAADPDAEMWGWGTPKRARFWPRRMLHETAVHRIDAELALDRAPHLDATVAVDGIDELLDNLPHAAYFAPNVDELRGNGETIAFEATDVDATWFVELRPDRFTWARPSAGDHADAVARGSALSLLLHLYGRGHDVELAGDAALIERFVTNAAI